MQDAYLLCCLVTVREEVDIHGELILGTPPLLPIDTDACVQGDTVYPCLDIAPLLKRAVASP